MEKEIRLVSEQKLDKRQLELKRKAYMHYEAFKPGCLTYHENARLCRKIYHLDDPACRKGGTFQNEEMLQMTTLRSTIDNCVADQMDNMPEAIMEPERADLIEKADDLTDITRHILAVNDWESIHRRRVEDFYITGTAVTQIVWDITMNSGKGDIAVFRYPIENMVWDTASENVQDSRAIIKVSWHPMSWYEQHYPEAYPFIASENEADRTGISDSKQDTPLYDDEDKAMLLEYWYRKFDAKKKRNIISVAYFAGGALLDEGLDVYEHGQYPFVFDVFARIEGEPVGYGLVDEMRDTMRAINRNSHYLDLNARVNAKTRILVNKNANVDMEAMVDFENDVVTADNIRQDGLAWFPNKPFNSVVPNEISRLQMDLKQDSGQNNFARGESGGGITAAAAIAALQEAGGKSTRYRTNILNSGFRQIVFQIMWVMREYYTNKSALLITGRANEHREIDMNSKTIFGGSKNETPPYAVKVQIQRRNPLRIQAQNELITQAFSMAAQSGQHFPLMLYFELMQIDGKDKILPALREVDGTTQMLQEAVQKAEMADDLMKENQALQQQVAQMQQTLKSQDEAIRGGLLDTVPDDEPTLEL